MTKKKELTEEDKKLTEEIAELVIEQSEDTLSAKQELFCQTFATKWGLFGNWVQTYIEVYEPNQSKPNWYKTACASSSRMLSNVKLIKRINELLEENWLSEVEVKKQHKYLIEQHTDLWVKMRAVDSFYKVNWMLTDKLEVSGSLSLVDLHNNTKWDD